MTTNLDDFLTALAAKYGVSSADAHKEAINTHLQRRAGSDQAMANKIAALFATANGVDVLNWLRANTLAKGQVPTDLLLTMRADQILQHAVFRAGEDSVVEMIELAISQSQKKPRRKRNAT